MWYISYLNSSSALQFVHGFNDINQIVLCSFNIHYCKLIGAKYLFVKMPEKKEDLGKNDFFIPHNFILGIKIVIYSAKKSKFCPLNKHIWKWIIFLRTYKAVLLLKKWLWLYNHKDGGDSSFKIVSQNPVGQEGQSGLHVSDFLYMFWVLVETNWQDPYHN